MNSKKLYQLISKYRGVCEANRFAEYKLESLQVLADTAKEFMTNVPPSFGLCTLMSAGWAGYLQDHYSVPAIVVAGDLAINNTKVFKCKKNLTVAKNTGKFIAEKWNGHCWIEVDGIIGDMSIFRTAYSIDRPSVLKNYIVSQFGYGRGAMICPNHQLPQGMKYIPKYVLTDNQINGLIAGMSCHLEHVACK